MPAARFLMEIVRPYIILLITSVRPTAGSASEGDSLKSDLKRKRRFGDRYDGYKVRAVGPFFVLIPHHAHKSSSMVFFEEEIEITALE